MLFMTFQPHSVAEQIKATGEYHVTDYHEFCNQCGVTCRPVEQLFGYKPIWATPIINIHDLAFRNLGLFHLNPNHL